MTRRVQDWISGYIDALLGERSAGAIAREARSEEEAQLMTAACRLKYQAVKDELEPRPEFAASLEQALQKELAKASPKVRAVVFWRLSWARTLGGVAAAAAVIMLLVWSRTGILLPTVPIESPSPAAERAAATAKQEADVPAAGPAKREGAAPAPDPALKPFGAAPAAPAPGAAPSPPAASPSPPIRTLAQAIEEAQTILLGQVADIAAAPTEEPGKGVPGPSDVRVVISVERYLKGPLPENRVTLRAAAGPASGMDFSKGKRVLVMARDMGGGLEILDYPRARESITAAEQAPAGAGDAKRLEGQQALTLEELVSRVEGLLGGKP